MRDTAVIEWRDGHGAAHRVSIEFEAAGGQVRGKVTSRYGASIAFSGLAELESALGKASASAAASALAGVERLTLTEREVLNAVLAGCSNREAADALLYSVKSIEAYLTRIYRTLGLQGRDDLLARATAKLEVSDGALCGTVAVGDGAPVAFRDVDELDRALGAACGLAAGATDDPLDRLTPVEREIVDAVVDGATNHEVARALFYSVKSIEAHLTRIYRTLGVRSRRELVELCAAAPR